MTNTCSTPRCDRPAPDATICAGCLHDLTTALRQLALGPLQRVRTHAAINPQAPHAGLRVVHDHLPGLLADLDDAITRQTSTAGGIGVLVRSAETALPYHAAASNLAHQARNTLTTWARLLLDHQPRLRLRGGTSTAALAHALAEHRQQLAQLDGAGEMVDTITGLARAIRRMVDRAPDLQFVGPCSHLHIVDGAVIKCTQDLWGIPGKADVHCPACGTTRNMAERREWLLALVNDQLATTQEIVTALPALLGEQVRLAAATIRSWVIRGKLDQHPPHPRDPRNRPTYRVGDVIDLVTTTGRQVS